MYTASSSYATYTTVLSDGVAPSTGSLCTNPVTRLAVFQIGSSRRPSITTGCPGRMARTRGTRTSGESAATGHGDATPDSARHNGIDIIRPLALRVIAVRHTGA